MEELLKIIELLAEAGLTVFAPVLVAWVVIRGLKLAGLSMSVLVQKWVVYVFSVGSVLVFSPVALPDLSLDPGAYLGALLALAAGVMKVAQSIYDKAWKALEGA